MSKMWNKLGLKVLGMAMVLAFASPATVKADGLLFGGGCCNEHCQHFHCPHTKVCIEGPPCICFRQGCAKPIINPCTQPNWGYYQPCWCPWPNGPDFSHCACQPPASMVFPPNPPMQEALPNRVGPRFNENVLPYPRPVQ